jgi:hypothetical protein
MSLKGARFAAPVGGVVAAGASVVCMASMGAMGAAATADMAGMGAAAATPHVPAVTRALRAVGLGALTYVPPAVLQPLLIVLLLVAIGTVLWRARCARTTPALALALLIVAAAAGLYASIYRTVSETGSWIALAVLILASILLPGAGGPGRITPIA